MLILKLLNKSIPLFSVMIGGNKLDAMKQKMKIDAIISMDHHKKASLSGKVIIYLIFSKSSHDRSHNFQLTSYLISPSKPMAFKPSLFQF